MGNLKKILPLIGVRGGGNVFFITPKRVRGMSKVFSTKRGSIQGFETPIRILAIFQKSNPLVGVRGEEVGSQLILIGNISVRDQCVQVSLFFCHIYPQYEFKVIFQVAYPSSDPHGGVTKGGFFLLF